MKNQRVTPAFFGMHVAIDADGSPTWPAFDVGAVRTGTKWRFIERTPGVYDWTRLDAQTATVEAHGATPMIVIGGTPDFHALDQTAPNTASAPRPAAFRNYVRALIARYGDRVDYQVWNEPNVGMFFTGSPAQMANLTRIVGNAAKQLAPAAKVVAPSFVLRGDTSSSRDWFRAYWSLPLGKGGRTVADVVDVAAISAYPMADEDPEDALALTQWATRLVANRGFDGPLWATEINYGGSGGEPTTNPISMDLQSAYVVRTFVLHATAGADRVYWWDWEGDQTINTLLNDGAGGLTPAGTAFGVVEDWLIGTKPTGCTVTRGITTCGFRVKKGLERQVSWKRSGRTRTMRAPEGARTTTDPAGMTTKVRPGDRLRIGVTPVMIKVRSR